MPDPDVRQAARIALTQIENTQCMRDAGQTALIEPLVEIADLQLIGYRLRIAFSDGTRRVSIRGAIWQGSNRPIPACSPSPAAKPPYRVASTREAKRTER